MPKNKGGGSGMPAGYPEVIEGVNNWNNQFQQWAPQSIEYAQGNPFSQNALNWQTQTLSGDMGNNPWMSRLYGQTQGLDMNEGMGYLREFLGGGEGPSGSGSGSGSSRPEPRYVFRSSTPNSGGHQGGGGGGIAAQRFRTPDSTVGQGWFTNSVNDVWDPAHLDPANDPTLRPMVDNMQREAEESYWRSVTDLTNQMEGSGRYGTGAYQAMRGQAQDEYHEALQATMAQLYAHSRDQALADRMNAMGMVNQRDMNEAQLAAQIEAANIGANASSSAAGAAAQAQREIAEQQMRLQGIGMMLDAGQFGLGLGGNMSQLMAQTQLGAFNGGLGYGQLGMSGYDSAANFGQLGLGAMGQLGNIYSSAASNRLAQQQAAESARRYNQEAPMRDFRSLVDIMSGLNTLGGYDASMPYIPSSPGPSPDGFDWGDALGGLMGGAAAYYNFGG